MFFSSQWCEYEQKWVIPYWEGVHWKQHIWHYDHFWRLVIYGHFKLTLNIVVEETSWQFQLLFGTFLGFQWMGDGVLLGCSKTGCHATNKPSFFDTIDYHRMSPSFAAAMKRRHGARHVIEAVEFYTHVSPVDFAVCATVKHLWRRHWRWS